MRKFSLLFALVLFMVSCGSDSQSYQIVFHGVPDDGCCEIFAMNTDGTNVRQLTSTEYDNRWASWSPDGTQIAFIRNQDEGGSEIFVMNADGTNVRQLTSTEYDNFWASWSPDGTQIAFTSDRGRGPEIYLMDADGTNVRQLTKTNFGSSLPIWSPDGTQIVFSIDQGASGRSNIFIMNADGSGAYSTGQQGVVGDWKN
jgi:TolB protein